MYYYTFSISHKGCFLFRTDKIQSIDNPKQVYDELYKRFPVSEGFKVTVMKQNAAYQAEDKWI